MLIAAPHTSNWDLPYTLMVGFALRLNLYWMGKESIFRPPFGALMRWLGGISVDREQSTNLVAASVEALRAADGPVQLMVPPEGTRSKARYWKTGFYHIAQGAQVPIVMAYMDYSTQACRPGPGVPSDRRHRTRHGSHQGVLRAVQGQEPRSIGLLSELHQGDSASEWLKLAGCKLQRPVLDGSPLGAHVAVTA